MKGRVTMANKKGVMGERIRLQPKGGMDSTFFDSLASINSQNTYASRHCEIGDFLEVWEIFGRDHYS